MRVRSLRSILISRLIQHRSARRKNRFRQPAALVLMAGRHLSTGMILFITFILGAAALGYVQLTSSLPSIDELSAYFSPSAGAFFQPTRFYDRTGQQLLYTLENPGTTRRYLPINPDRPETLSPRLIVTTIAYNEPNFWQSGGYSSLNLFAEKPLTIAEKLVDSLLLENEKPDLRKALRMRLLAAQITSRYGRTRVLEWYLNSAYYGHKAYGADMAAQAYLGKPATELNLAESALLIAAADAPALNPLDAPAAALERQQAVLHRLRSSGLIGEPEYQQALVQRVVLSTPRMDRSGIARTFSSLLSEQMEQHTGRTRLESGGLQVISSLDADLQVQSLCTLQVQLARIQGKTVPESLPDGRPCSMARLLPVLPAGKYSPPEELRASIVIYDPLKGEVLAFVGDLGMDGENPMLETHEPGSLLTPFIAMSAFTRGYSPASLLWDIPNQTDSKTPLNPDGKYHGPQRLRMAVANDYLVPINRLLDQLGPANVWRLAETLGLTGLSGSPNPAVLLSRGGKITLLQAAQAYGVLAAQGSMTRINSSLPTNPRALLARQAVDNNGRVFLTEETPGQVQLVSTPIAYLVHHMLSDEYARRPSLGQANALEIGRPAAGKIGQVADGNQVWAAGYTRERVVVVWLGGSGSRSSSRLDPALAAGIWHAAMQYANRNQTPSDWKIPAGITRVDVCDPSGLRPTADCPFIVSELFLNGSEPTTTDNLYRKFQINRETGRLATVFTPFELVEERTYLTVPSEVRPWAAGTGMPLPPEDYDVIQAPVILPHVQISSPTIFSYTGGNVAIQGTASGTGFAAYRLQAGRGLNPATWTPIGDEKTIPVENSLLGNWNTSGLDGIYSLRLLVVRQDQKLEIAATQITLDNTPPTARVIYPGPGQMVTAVNGQIIFQAEVSDNLGVARTEWLLNGKEAGVTRQAPFVLPWNAAVGVHQLEIIVHDLAGNRSKSLPVEFSISPTR